MCVDIYLYLLIYRNGSSAGPPPADWNVIPIPVNPLDNGTYHTYINYLHVR